MSYNRNLLSNFAGNAWMAFLSLALVPFYIRFMGIESYGLMGIYGTLQAFASLLDMGLTLTMNREMARRSVIPNRSAETRNLVRTLEVVYWTIAVFIGLLVCLFAPFLAQHWIKTVNLSPAVVQQSIFLIGIVMVFQWPYSFYSGGLMGLQRQQLLASVNAGMATLRGAGAILILWRVSPTIQAFLIWQAFISLSFTLLVMFLLWKSLPKADNKPVFQKSEILSVWRFSAAVSAIGILGLVITQSDKIVLSRVLTLENFGYYSLAGTVSTSIYMLINPIYNATFPRMAQMLSTGDQEGLKCFYHYSAQLLSSIILPIVLILSVFSREIMLVWQGNVAIATNTYQIVTLLVLGTGLHGLAHIPWALRLSFGWTKYDILQNILSIIIFVPLMVYFSSLYGGLGSATVWILFNAICLIVSVHITFRRFLNETLREWMMFDVFKPLFCVLIITSISKFIIIHFEPTRFILLLSITMITIVTFSVSALSLTAIRIWLFKLIVKTHSKLQEFLYG